MSKKNKPRQALADELVAETAEPTPARSESLEVLEKAMAEMRSVGAQVLPCDVLYSVQRCPQACQGLIYEYREGLHQERVVCPVCKGWRFVKVPVEPLEVMECASLPTRPEEKGEES